MNSIRQIQELNKRELENGVSSEASWHADYRDTAYVFIGGLPFELSEGDVITIFSQFGEPTYINLVRDKETGKSKGFAFLKYADQRSTDLAVDNLGGAVIMGRTLKVDHTRYKMKDDELEGEIAMNDAKQIEDDDRESRRKRRRTSETESGEERPMLQVERELAVLIQEHDEDDPMKAFLIQEKREEVALALAKLKDGKQLGRNNRHRHHHRSGRPKKGEGREELVGEGQGSRHVRRRDARRSEPSGKDGNTRAGSKTGRGRTPEQENSKEYTTQQLSLRRDNRDGERAREEFDGGSDRYRRTKDDSWDDRHRRSRRDS